jgi:hypothetical protein
MKTLGAIFLAFGLAGCIDLDEAFQINPDGSGKVVVRMVFTPFRLDFGPEKDPSSEDQLKDAARDEIEKAKGVEAWSDVAWTRRPDGKAEFKGTAYFKDLAALKLHTQGLSGFPGTLTLKKTPAGGFTLEAAPEEKPEAPPALSDAEVKKKLAEERAQYQQSKAFLQGMLAELKVRASFTFPGAVEGAACFRKAGASTAQLSLEGKALLKAFDDLMMNDALLEAQIRARGDLKGAPPPDAGFFQALFGEKGPPQVSTAAGAVPLFDWAKEVAAAKALEPIHLKSLGARAAPPPAAKGGALKSVKVVGVKWVHATDEKRGVRPLNTMEPGLTLALLVELPGAALAVKEGMLARATTDAGEDLLPKRDWDRAVHFPQLTEDKAGVAFDVLLKLPGPAAKGLKEVAGTLTYLVGTATKDVDLGFPALKSGSKGKDLGAELGDVEDRNFELKLAVPRETVAGVELYDAAGKKLDLEPAGSMSTGRSTTLSYALKARLPAQGRIVAKVWQDLTPHEVPFSVKDLDLLGRPLKQP